MGELARIGVSLTLPTLLLLLFSLLWLFDVGGLGWLASPFAPIFLDFGARHEGTCHVTPVKVLIVKPVLFHFRHGVPVRSRARSPAFIAPRLALGPSLWVGAGATPGTALFVGFPSVTPFSLFD